MEADDGNLYVVKFRAAGQGTKALIAELIGGLIGSALALNVPEIVFIELDPAIGAAEPDPEIRDLVMGSSGINLGMAFLPNALTFSPIVPPFPSSQLASTIVWFDGLIMNVDRTPRNTNILRWEDDLWLIDHGAALYVHHTWTDLANRSRSPFPLIRDHVLLPFAADIAGVDAELAASLTSEFLNDVVSAIPADWLAGDAAFPDEPAHRAAYLSYLSQRLTTPRLFVEEAVRVRAELI